MLPGSLCVKYRYKRIELEEIFKCNRNSSTVAGTKSSGDRIPHINCGTSHIILRMSGSA
jgi:hypothetical protein